MKKTKLYVLTGFLGSGKTTVLLRILKELEGQRVGIIQNEFGKLSIDGTILRNDDIQMIEITRGSVFCSCLKLNFVNALSEMVKQGFDYLFVESSGFGDPSNLNEILEASKVVSGQEFDFRGVLCLVDALNFKEQSEDLEMVNRQLKHCHLAIVTKTDLVEMNLLNEVMEKIREFNPKCKIEICNMGEMDYGFLQEDLIPYQWAACEESTNRMENKPKTLSLECEMEIEKEALLSFLSEIAPDVYRSKGFCSIKGEGWHQVDLVGKKADLKPSESFEKSQLVFISKIGPALIRKLFAAWEETVGIPMKLKN